MLPNTEDQKDHNQEKEETKEDKYDPLRDVELQIDQALRGDTSREPS